MNPNNPVIQAIQALSTQGTPSNTGVVQASIKSPTKNAMHPDDIQQAVQAISRRVFNGSNINYAIGQGTQDEKTIRDLAQHYIGKDIIQKYKSNTDPIAQELLNRVMVDQGRA